MPGKKQDNRRVYPDATRQPRHLDSLRKEEAKERQEAYDKLTLEEKLAKLPPEPGAAKQRARLLSLLEKKNQKAETQEKTQPSQETPEKGKKQNNLQKKYMKGAK